MKKKNKVVAISGVCYPGGRKKRERTKRPTAVPETGPYYVGMHSWIIQDGNYGDFRIDRDYQFAIEYWSTSLVPLEPHAKHERSIRHVEENHYRVVAQVKHAQPSWTVIDFGLSAYGGPNIDPSYEVGSWVRGEISISTDPFPYFESLNKKSDAPALIYRWHLEEIQIQTAPFVETQPRQFVRDENKWG